MSEQILPWFNYIYISMILIRISIIFSGRKCKSKYIFACQEIVKFYYNSWNYDQFKQLNRYLF